MVCFGSHLRGTNILIQLTHSLLPLSLLILGCYTCSSFAGTSIATYEGYMSRDNGSSLMICNKECTISSFESINEYVNNNELLITNATNNGNRILYNRNIDSER